MASPDQRDSVIPFPFDLFLDLAINFYAEPHKLKSFLESPKT